MNLQPNQRITIYFNGQAYNAIVTLKKSYIKDIVWIRFDDNLDKEEWYTIDEIRRIMKND
jgi:hypothetical protein